MQQYMLHCLQQKHRLKIQLLLLIVPILSREMQQEFTDPVTDCAFLPRLCFFVFFFFFGGTKFSLSDKELSSSESDSSLCDAIWIASLTLRMLNTFNIMYELHSTRQKFEV